MLKKLFFLHLLITINTQNELQGKSSECLILNPIGDKETPHLWSGFFSCFNGVIGGLDHYEKNSYAGCRVKFEWGLYLDSKKGPDWWNYYFEPINIGSLEQEKFKYIDNEQRCLFSYYATSSISRKRASELINKYVFIKPFLQNKINRFIEKNFRDYFMIGIHYRGTDKSKEALRVDYSDVYSELNKIITGLSPSVKYKIFIATDEKGFIDYMEKTIDPKKICYLNSVRSSNGNPIHLNLKNPLQQGMDSVMDCMLLANTNILLRTLSNLSSAAGNFNPTLPIITLNKSFADKEYPNIR
jgi:hypothetical protein